MFKVLGTGSMIQPEYNIIYILAGQSESKTFFCICINPSEVDERADDFNHCIRSFHWGHSDKKFFFKLLYSSDHDFTLHNFHQK